MTISAIGLMMSGPVATANNGAKADPSVTFQLPNDTISLPIAKFSPGSVGSGATLATPILFKPNETARDPGFDATPEAPKTNLPVADDNTTTAINVGPPPTQPDLPNTTVNVPRNALPDNTTVTNNPTVSVPGKTISTDDVAKILPAQITPPTTFSSGTSGSGITLDKPFVYTGTGNALTNMPRATLPGATLPGGVMPIANDPLAKIIGLWATPATPSMSVNAAASNAQFSKAVQDAATSNYGASHTNSAAMLLAAMDVTA